MELKLTADQLRQLENIQEMIFKFLRNNELVRDEGNLGGSLDINNKF